MSTVSITNTVEPGMNSQIEEKIYLLLGSSLTSLRLIEAVIEDASPAGQQTPLVDCKVRALERHGKWHLVSNRQRDPMLALDGALNRLRRSLARNRLRRGAA